MPLKVAVTVSARAGVSREGSPGEGRTAKLSHWVSAGLGSLRVVGLRSSCSFGLEAGGHPPCGSLRHVSWQLASSKCTRQEARRESQLGKQISCA